jgi:hypothetical protein
MGMKTATTATVEKKVRKARGIDTEKVAALIESIKSKKPEFAKILMDRLQHHVEARDEAKAAASALKSAVDFVKSEA